MWRRGYATGALQGGAVLLNAVGDRRGLQRAVQDGRRSRTGLGCAGPPMPVVGGCSAFDRRCRAAQRTRAPRRAVAGPRIGGVKAGGSIDFYNRWDYESVAGESAEGHQWSCSISRNPALLTTVQGPLVALISKNPIFTFSEVWDPGCLWGSPGAAPGGSREVRSPEALLFRVFGGGGGAAKQLYRRPRDGQQISAHDRVP